MKTKLLLILSLCLEIAMLQAQDPVITTRLVNRNIHEQDGHYLIITLGASPYIYGTHNESILSTYFNPLLIVVEDTTGITSSLPIEGLRLYPNPVHDKLLLQRENWKEAYTIEVFTLHGISVMKTTWPVGASGCQLGVAPLPSGALVVTVSNPDSSRRSQYKILKR